AGGGLLAPPGSPPSAGAPPESGTSAATRARVRSQPDPVEAQQPLGGLQDQKTKEDDRHAPEVEDLALDRAGVGKLPGFRELADVGDGEIAASGRGSDALEQRAVLLRVVVL